MSLLSVSQDGQDGEFGVALGRINVVNDLDRGGSDDPGREVASRSEIDGRAAPFGDRVGGRDDENTRGAGEASAQSGNVDGPREALAIVALELHLDDNPKDWLAFHEQDDQIRAILRGRYVCKIRPLQTHLRISGQCQVPRVAQQPGGKLRAIAE